MKALSVSPAMAMMLVCGEKTIECRSWRTDYRGDILICSTAKKQKGFISGHALGVVELVDITQFRPEHLWPAFMAERDYDPSFFAWIMANPRFIKPIPVKGKLSLWTYDGEVEILPPAKSEEEDQKRFDKYWKHLIV